jgi:flavin reductase (DIM6/NTAB) family NADH-FMN oxidoreductase RutF
MKRRLGPSDRLFPMPVPLVVSGSGDELGVMAVAWIGIASATPPSVGMAIRNSRRTLELIRATREFTVNIPPVRLAEVVDYCGIVSGRKTDKFADTGLTPLPSAVVSTPILAECPYNMECRVTQELELGEYALVIGEVVETHVEEEAWDAEAARIDLDVLDPLAYCGGVREYRGLTPKVADAFVVGKRYAR